jgi:glycosyltransferase involved in cell wall biosynthesis
MNVSIAIATYNRAAEVEKTLATLARLDTAGCPEYEILLIDNNSPDATAEVVNRFVPLFGGRLRYVREEKQGLSHARNRAIEEAKFEIVSYLDDDVDVDPNWLRCLCDAFAGGAVAAVGGRAYLVFPGPKPAWLGDAIEGLLTKVELGDARRPCLASEVYGVNMSFQKTWLLRAGGFRTDLGRVGTTLFGGEDADMLERVAALGGTIVYDPGAAVGHRVPPSRLRRRWFLSRCYWGNVSAAQLWPDERIGAYEFARMSWWVVRAAGGIIRPMVRHGPRSAACFAKILRLTLRLGLLAGLVSEIRARRFRSRRHRPSCALPNE